MRSIDVSNLDSKEPATFWAFLRETLAALSPAHMLRSLNEAEDGVCLMSQPGETSHQSH